MRTLVTLALFLTLYSAQGSAVNEAPRVIAVERLPWVSPPPVPGLRLAWVLGGEGQSGLYAIRVKLARGAIIPPHSHPDTRNSTVLSGTLYVGFGAHFDSTKLVAIPRGDVYVAPAGVPHYLLARDGDVVYQESGIGPTATRIVKAP